MNAQCVTCAVEEQKYVGPGPKHVGLQRRWPVGPPGRTQSSDTVLAAGGRDTQGFLRMIHIQGALESEY